MDHLTEGMPSIHGLEAVLMKVLLPTSKEKGEKKMQPIGQEKVSSGK